MDRKHDLIDRLPYSGNMRLVTEIIDISPDKKSLRAWHIYPPGDPMVGGHCMGKYVAGSLLTEQICQTALLLLYVLPYELNKDAAMPLLGKVCSDYFEPVPAGERVETEVRILHALPGAVVFSGTAFIKTRIVVAVKASAQIVS